MSPNPTFETEQAAKAFFLEKLHKRWLAREENPDFHIDYVVELDGPSGPSGKKFGVQLKGTRSANYVGEELSFRMEVKHHRGLDRATMKPVPPLGVRQIYAGRTGESEIVRFYDKHAVILPQPEPRDVDSRSITPMAIAQHESPNAALDERRPVFLDRMNQLLGGHAQGTRESSVLGTRPNGLRG